MIDFLLEKEILDNNRKRPIELISAGNKRARLDRRNQKDRDRRKNESEDEENIRLAKRRQRDRAINYFSVKRVCSLAMHLRYSSALLVIVLFYEIFGADAFSKWVLNCQLKNVWENSCSIETPGECVIAGNK